VTPEAQAAGRYFAAIDAALGGLALYLAEARERDGLAEAVAEQLVRLRRSFSCWRNRIGFADTFKINRAASGFPLFQNVLALENDRAQADRRLGDIPGPDALRAEMADFILRRKGFPLALQRAMAERLYLEDVKEGQTFGPFGLARTLGVSVEPKTGRPVCLVQWAAFDGTANLPLVYLLKVEDSTPKLAGELVDGEGRLRTDVEIPLPVDGLLNPELAHRFDDFTERNSAYALSPLTIAANLDRDFPTLHPKELKRFVLGPFFGAGLTDNNPTVTEVLSRMRRAETAWLLTWTVQHVFSTGEVRGRQGLWSSDPPIQTFHIETGDPEAVRQGVSAYEKHALVPHEAYQALYAAGEADKIFAGFKAHILSKGSVISDV
jgi:hypothetical protein